MIGLQDNWLLKQDQSMDKKILLLLYTPQKTIPWLLYNCLLEM